MKAAIIGRALRRRELYKHSFVTPRLPFPTQHHEHQILGTYSMILMSSKRRIVLMRDMVKLLPNLSETPPAVARDYLCEKYKRGPRLKNWQIDNLEEELKAAPLYARPCVFDEGWYVDIEATYWEVMLASGWDIDYLPNKWLCRGTPPDDFPFSQHKISRNCLVSAGAKSSLPVWNPKALAIDHIRAVNRLSNPALIRLISDILNSIAALMCKAGAVYVNADGYIFTSQRAADEAQQIIRDWGLVPRIKAHGAGEVRGPGSYKVGDITSRIVIEKAEFYNTTGAPEYWRWLHKSWSPFCHLSKYVSTQA